MKKRVYFDVFDGPGWPTSGELKPYFLGSPGRRSSFEPSESGNDCWGLTVEGVKGTEHLSEGNGRIDVRLTMLGNVNHGVLLYYRRWGGGYHDSYYSKGNLTRLQEWVETKDGDLMPVGLYVPSKIAWQAVKEFMEKDGELPNSIMWVADSDIPAGAFPG